MKKLLSSRGETLIESLCAVLIVTLVMLFLSTAIATAARVNHQVRQSNHLRYYKRLPLLPLSGGDTAVKLKNESGLTLVEMLCCVVVMLLVSIGMVNGVSLAVRNYESSLMSSESQVLCSTLTNLVSDELRYSGAVNWEADPIRFYSRTYGS